MCHDDERILLEHHHLAHAELARLLGGDRPSVRTDDALAAMERDGLVNRLDRFAWPTRAALRFDTLGPI